LIPFFFNARCSLLSAWRDITNTERDELADNSAQADRSTYLDRSEQECRTICADFLHRPYTVRPNVYDELIPTIRIVAISGRIAQFAELEADLGI
jgi:hypothetical protein